MSGDSKKAGFRLRWWGWVIIGLALVVIAMVRDHRRWFPR